MSTAAIQEEIKIKKQQLVEFMDKHKLAGVLVSLHENVSWATAGQVDMRIGIPAPTGAAAALPVQERRRRDGCPDPPTKAFRLGQRKRWR